MDGTAGYMVDGSAGKPLYSGTAGEPSIYRVTIKERYNVGLNCDHIGQIPLSLIGFDWDWDLASGLSI